MSSLSNRNTDNTRSITLVPSSLASSLKVQSTLKSVIRGVLLSKLFWWLMFLIPPVRSLASECRACVVAIILSLSEIMPTCFRCVLKGLIYVVIMAPLGCQPSSYAECIKLNIRSSCDVKLVFNAECICLICFYILRSLRLLYLICLRVLYNSYCGETWF